MQAPAAGAVTLSLSTPPPPLVLSHITTATTTAVYTVAGLGTWTLQVADGSATTPGYMDRVSCVGGSLLGGSLASPMTWSSITSNRSGTLSSTPATVATGTIPGTVSLTFSQALTNSDAVVNGNCYSITVTVTVV